MNRKEERLKCMTLIIIIGMGLFFAFSYFYRRYLWAAFPDGDFLFPRGDAFMDYFNVNAMIARFDPYVGHGSSYPPAILLVAYLFSLFGSYKEYEALEVSKMLLPRVSYVLMVTLTAGAVCWIFYLILRQFITNKKILFLCIPLFICTAPYIFMLDRGNYLMVCMIFIMLFIYYFDKKPKLAAVMLGIAAAMKIYPVFLFLLYLVKKQYKELGIATGTGALLTFVPLFFFQGGFLANLKSMLGAIAGFAGGSPISSVEATYYGVGLTSLLNLRYTWFCNGERPEKNSVMIIFLIIGSALALWSLWNIRKEQNQYRSLSLLTILMVFLIPNSYMYNLVYLFVPIVCWIIDDECYAGKQGKVYGILLGVLMVAKAYYYPLSFTNTSIAVLIDSLLLLGISIWLNIDMIRKNKGV